MDKVYRFTQRVLVFARLIFQFMPAFVTCLFAFTSFVLASSPEETDLERVKRIGQLAINSYQAKEIELRKYLNQLVIDNDHPSFSDRSFDILQDLLVVHLMGRFFSNFQEKLDPLITIEVAGDKHISLSAVLEACEEDRLRESLKRTVLGTDAIQKQTGLALRNGHIRGYGPTTAPAFEEKEPFRVEKVVSDQKTLVLGCGHRSLCCVNHQDNTNLTHYTIDIDESVGPDVVSNFYDRRLWEMLPPNRFGTVILEGAGDIKDVLLIKAIFNVLKSGGVLKTLHGHSSLVEKEGACTVDAFLYNITIPLTGQPLLQITYKEHLEKIGFKDIEIYVPTLEEDLDSSSRTPQIRAFKP